MTALDPPGHGVRHNGIFRLPEAIPTLAERLREAGYATGAVVGSLVLDRRYGLARLRLLRRSDGRTHGRRLRAGPSGAPTASSTPRSRCSIRSARASSCWVHFYDPHLTYDPPPGFASAFASRPYAGEIAFADAQLGRLLGALRERYGEAGLLVVATSDHGESFGEHGDETHSYLIYETTQRIPLLFAGPGVPAGRSVAAPVGLVDVAPTVLALARAKPLAEAAGRDLRPLFAGEGRRAGERVLRDARPAARLRLEPAAGPARGEFKYIRAPRPELYDLAADPGERAQPRTRAARARRLARCGARGEAARARPRGPRHRWR